MPSLFFPTFVKKFQTFETSFLFVVALLDGSGVPDARSSTKTKGLLLRWSIFKTLQPTV